MKIIGLMSGTSMDGIDASLVEVSGRGPRPRVREVASSSTRYPRALRERVMAAASGDSLSALDLAELSVRVASTFAAAVRKVTEKAGVRTATVDLVASHGQTVAHRPGKPACTVQIGEAACIAEHTGITTVADFRVADTAAGGEGAPLAPMAHHLLFADSRRTRALQNLGGIGNVTWLPAGAGTSEVAGSDTGPANILIDACMELLSDGSRHFDRGGALAAQGRSDERLVKEILRQPFFRRRLPASTGREEFGLPLARRLISAGRHLGLDDASIVASVTRASARGIACIYRRLSVSPPDEVLVCGGGAKNATLLAMLREELECPSVATTADLGVDPDYVEAVAFALLGYLTVTGRTGNVPSATGARAPRILGKIVPGRNYRRTVLA